ncbi:hypothetical protein B0I73DRAFT_2374 [Yarrowia lipolytica]|nr:hypothetical protein B0I73DRAFT_2374 [Yarrowia lipolytica]
MEKHWGGEDASFESNFSVRRWDTQTWADCLLVYVGRRELWQYLDHMSRDTTNKAPAEEDSYNLLHVFQLQPRNFVPLKG